MIRKAAAKKSGAAGRSGEQHTPMMRQYFAAKERHPREILFFRMGDFYEMFFEDAEIVAEQLGITLTSRSKDKAGVRIPMAGIPVKSVDGYIRRLLELGHRVAICEQVTDPKESTGIVDREVVRVVTPGTFVEADTLDDSTPLHLCALIPEKDLLGVAWVDLSTGRFTAEDFRGERQWEEALLRIAPAECLAIDGAGEGDIPALDWLRTQMPRCSQTPFPDWHFERATARERLLAHFGTQTLEGFGCEHLGPALRSAGALIHYLRETQKQTLSHITRLTAGSSGQRLRLDAATHRALDLVEVARTGERHGSLLGHMDRTRTPMGARQLREWLTAPLLVRSDIMQRQQAVAALVDDRERRKNLRQSLRNVRDIERLVSRLPLGRINGRDLKALEQSLRATPAIVEDVQAFEPRLLTELVKSLPTEPLLAIADAIGSAIVDEPPITIKEGGVIRDGYDPELDELRVVSREGVSWIAAFQEQEAQRTGISNLKVGYNRVFGYYLEVTQSQRDKVPDDYTRKQTLKNAERYITPSLKEQEGKVLGAKERAEQLEFQLFQRLREEIQRQLEVLQLAADALAQLDSLLALATVADEEGYVAPVVSDDPILDIDDGRHPVVAAGIGKNDFTPNDIHLGAVATDNEPEGTLSIITGPNMSGKSTYIRQAALITILTQMGSFVPAKQATVGIADRIFTRVGAADDLTRGQSTFMVEMTETANILNNATSQSLVILDEVGRGTSTHDGISLAWAIAEQLVEHTSARTLFATHYHELTELQERFPGQVKNLNVAVREWQDQIVFLHKIIPGGTDKAYGIHVARLAGIPPTVLERAREILSHLETQGPRDRVPAPTASPYAQLDLFSAVNEELRKAVNAIDPDEMTPRQALEELYRLRKLAKE
ncbi:MAG: DNA mismatch repair protein MutS [Planctomycetota bacterium]